MGLMSFIKDAGEKLFGGKEAQAEPAAATQTAAPEQDAAKSRAAGDAIANYIRSQGLKVSDLKVDFDAPSSTVTIEGTVPDQATREKVVLSSGNVTGVAAVDDRLVVVKSEPASQWHTVVKGDNLSKIAKAFYGDANKYPLIFEANRPMLADPDKIYPGQVLRIPPRD
jgi:nucleoid-associated protein YgaU